ncbi:hypothetical protein ES705_42169 [subsurface metagenome]
MAELLKTKNNECSKEGVSRIYFKIADVTIALTSADPKLKLKIDGSMEKFVTYSYGQPGKSWKKRLRVISSSIPVTCGSCIMNAASIISDSLPRPLDRFRIKRSRLGKISIRVEFYYTTLTLTPINQYIRWNTLWMNFL